MAIIGLRHIGLKIMSIALAALLWLVVAGEQASSGRFGFRWSSRTCRRSSSRWASRPTSLTCAFADRPDA